MKVIKNELIDKKMKEMGLALITPRARRTGINRDAYGAGKAAGDRASFGELWTAYERGRWNETNRE